jgi:hypothetical protein
LAGGFRVPARFSQVQQGILAAELIGIVRVSKADEIGAPAGVWIAARRPFRQFFTCSISKRMCMAFQLKSPKHLHSEWAKI